MAEVLYLEIGSEEIPAGYILPALEAMSAQMVRFLTKTVSATENRSRRELPDGSC